MTFLEAWNLTFAWAIASGCFIVAAVALGQTARAHGLYRVTRLIAFLVCGWVGFLYLVFWGIQRVPIPTEYFRPSIFALVALILALLLGYRRYEHR